MAPLTIILTGQPSIRIDDAHWPRIATTELEAGLYVLQLNVRQHADGRRIVYATLTGKPGYAVANERHGAGIVLEPRADILIAIRQVAQDIAQDFDDKVARELMRACVASLNDKGLA
jgi:hypothetical protein